jgi:predicted HicB family RNase H-like nuclease
MARPTRQKTPSEERLEVRLSRAEKARLRADAARAKMSVSDYVRRKTGVDRAEA